MNSKLHFILFICCLSAACTKDFAEINTDERLVDKPDIKFLLSYTEDKIANYEGQEWIYENLEQLLRYTQHISASPFELSANVNTRYNAYYKDILPNLFEIRRQVEAMTDKDSYQKMVAVTYILQVLHGLKVTDMNGSIPYTEAMRGRYEGEFNPVYDSQKSLFNTWLSQLNNAVKVMRDNTLPFQNTYNTTDLYYQGDFTKWIKLANTLKLRIAMRYENQDAEETRTIFKEVMEDNTGPINDDESQLIYTNVNVAPIGGPDIDYRSERFGSTSLIDFMKKSMDPRLPIYFSANNLTGSYADSLVKYQAILPSFINPADPLIAFQGGPADWTTEPARAAFMNISFPVGPNRYSLISTINKRFFAPGHDNGNGSFMHLLAGYAETCFYISECIEKGYGIGVNTKGSAGYWYTQGIISSLKTMNSIAKKAGSTTAYTNETDGLTLINNYLNRAEIILAGSNNLEKIYIQQYINFYRAPNEAFVFCRRTGYPKNGSAYYPRELFNETIPRRFWLNDPGETNRENWLKAIREQGFTIGSRNLTNLSSERLWYDTNAPDFGEGK